MNVYTSGQVAALVGAPYETLMRWARQGLLSPEGGGRQRVNTYWHPKDVREASILAGLRAAHFSLQWLREAVTFLRDLGHNPMSSGQFLVVLGNKGDPRELVKICSTGEAIALMRKHRGQLILPLWSPPVEDEHERSLREP